MVTATLSAAALPEAGNSLRTEDLVGLCYTELKKIASRRLADERAGHSLRATGLAHEAVLRLMKGANPTWPSEGHFFAACSEAMRRILVEAARKRATWKRGRGRNRLDVDVGDLADDRHREILAMNELLDGLAAVDAEAATLVQLRYFGGLDMAEVAAALGISLRSAGRRWTFARAWLARELGADDRWTDGERA